MTHEIRLLALDLDGTLFGDDLLISNRVREAISQAQASGVMVIIATGRIFRVARDIARDLGLGGPVICYQGALVRDGQSGVTLDHKTIPTDAATLIIREARQRGLHLNLYLDDNLYVESMSDGAHYYATINKGLEINEVGSLETFLQAQPVPEPTKLVIITEPERTDRVLSEFSKRWGSRLQVTKSHPRFTEFTNGECSKGRALAALAAHFGLSSSQVMAIGDGHNDRDMIEWAGVGVAISGARRDVLLAADYVAPALEEDGAAVAIERFILGKTIRSGTFKAGPENH